MMQRLCIACIMTYFLQNSNRTPRRGRCGAKGMQGDQAAMQTKRMMKMTASTAVSGLISFTRPVQSFSSV